MAIIETGGGASGTATVDSNNRLQVSQPTSSAQAGYNIICGSWDENRAVVVPISASTQGQLGTGQLQPDFEQGFAASAISPSIWRQDLTTMTTSISSNALVLNAGSSLANGAVARVTSWRTVKVTRGADRVTGVRVLLPAIVANAVLEFGVFTASGTSAPTSGAFFRYAADGSLRGVAISSTGVEVTTSAISVPTLNAAHDYLVIISATSTIFEIDNVVVGTASAGSQAVSPVGAESSPFCVRLYNSAATLTACQPQVFRWLGGEYGGIQGRVRTDTAALNGDVGSQGVVGGSTGVLANYANSAAPSSATLSNTAAGYTTLGGQWQFAAVAGAETDYALFAFQVPAMSATNQGRTLIVRGVWIDTVNTGAAVATTATVLQWSLGYDSSAVSLATADGANTKARRVIPLGIQTFAVGAAIGATANQIAQRFSQPVAVSAGNYLHIILKMPIGTATASQVIRGTVGIDATWE